MWSGKGSQLQDKGLGYRGESPRPEADSTEKRVQKAIVRAFQNMCQEPISPLKDSRPETSTASVNTEQSLVAAQLQSRASQLLEGQAQPWGCWLIQALDNFPGPAFTASAVSQASISSLGLTALTVDIYMTTAQGIVFSRLLSHVKWSKHKTTSGNRL